MVVVDVSKFTPCLSVQKGLTFYSHAVGIIYKKENINWTPESIPTAWYIKSSNRVSISTLTEFGHILTIFRILDIKCALTPTLSKWTNKLKIDHALYGLRKEHPLSANLRVTILSYFLQSIHEIIRVGGSFHFLSTPRLK